MECKVKADLSLGPLAGRREVHGHLLPQPGVGSLPAAAVVPLNLSPLQGHSVHERPFLPVFPACLLYAAKGAWIHTQVLPLGSCG